MGSVGRSRANACKPCSKTGATVWSRYWRVGRALGSARVAVGALGFLAGGGCCAVLAVVADAGAAVAAAPVLELELLVDAGAGAVVAAVGAEVAGVCALLLAVAATPVVLVSLAASADGVGFVVVAGESALASIAPISLIVQ